MLLDGFECAVDDEPVPLVTGARRLLAFLAVASGPVHRGQIARNLWPGQTESRAAANLRSALWQVRRSPVNAAITAVEPRLRITDGVHVDFRQVTERLTTTLDESDERPGFDELLQQLRSDLLPDWNDGWLDLERERWRNTRIYALEQLAEACLQRGAHHAAHAAALEAIAAEPLRETAHRLAISIHLAEGNPASALRHYHRYCDMLQSEMDVTPSHLLEELVRPVLRPDLRIAPGHRGSIDGIHRSGTRRHTGR